MTCEQFESLLARAADGTLDAERRKQLDHHLATCTGCRDRLETQTETRAALSERSAAPVPLGFAMRVMASLEPKPATGWADWMDALNWRAWTFRLAPVAGALLVAAALGLGRSDRIEPAGAVDFSELVTAWVASDTDAASEATLDTVTLLYSEDDTDDVLLDILLTPGMGTAF